MAAHPRRAAACLAGSALALVVGSAAPVEAADTVSDKNKAARQLDELRATDDELDAAAATLDTALGAARRKANAAVTARIAAERELEASMQEASSLRAAVAERAVTAYVRSGAVPDGPIQAGDDPVEALHLLALRRVVDARVVDMLDRYRAAAVDLRRQRDALARRATAAQRAADEAAAAKADSAAARAKLDRRIAQLEEEIAEQERGEPELVAVIAKAPRPVAAAAAPPAGNGRLSFPMNGGRTTSEFGPRWGRMHKGLDIAAPTGTPILAAAAGTVIHAGWQGGYGNLVLVDHGGGMVTAYGHQSRLGTTRGATVGRGQTIGFVGSTGHSTGPHLHFEVRINGKAENPRRHL